jgi:hypothetical protein
MITTTNQPLEALGLGLGQSAPAVRARSFALHPKTVRRVVFAMVVPVDIATVSDCRTNLSLFADAGSRDRARTSVIATMLASHKKTLNDFDDDLRLASVFLGNQKDAPPLTLEFAIDIPADGDTATIDALRAEIATLTREKTELADRSRQMSLLLEDAKMALAETRSRVQAMKQSSPDAAK